jgi:hypothetical protein
VLSIGIIASPRRESDRLLIRGEIVISVYGQIENDKIKHFMSDSTREIAKWSLVKPGNQNVYNTVYLEYGQNDIIVNRTFSDVFVISYSELQNESSFYFWLVMKTMVFFDDADKMELYNEFSLSLLLNGIENDAKDSINKIISESDDIKMKMQFIIDYEKNNPEHAKIMNEFLKSVIDDATYPDDVRNIKYLSYFASDPFKKILFNYLPEVNIKTFKETGVQHYSPGAKSISISLNPNKASKLPTGPYNTFFHELGHAMDHLMKIDTIFDRESYGLQKQLRNDINKILIDEINAVSLNISSTEINEIVESFNTGGTPLTPGSKLETIRNNIIQSLNAKLKNDENCVASDVYGGFTKNELQGDYGHGINDMNGNPTNYWTDVNGNETGAQSSEWFAGYFSASITNYPNNLSSISGFFPETKKSIDKEMEMVANKI